MKSLAKELSDNKIWTKNFTFLIISLLLISCANYYFASSMAIYAKIISSSGTYAGLITASFYVGSVGMRLVNGTLVQKCGAHKLILISAGLCLAACFAHNFAGIIIVLLIFRILHGVGYSIFSTASGTAASYMVPKNRIGEGMGYFTLGNVLAMAVGPSIALAIVSANTLSQFHYLFDTAAVICAIALILVCFIKVGQTDGSDAEKIEQKIATQKLPKTFLGFEKGVVLPVIISFLMTFSYSPVIIYLSVYGLQKGLGNVGIAFTMYAVGLLSSRLFTGRLSDRFGPDCVMIPAYICGMISLSTIAFCSAKWQLYLAMVVLGLCIGAYNPQINVFCISRCSKERRGTATAAFNGASDLGLAVGSAVTGIYIDHFGYTFTYLNGACVCLVTLILYILTISNIANRRKKLPTSADKSRGSFRR